MLKAMRHESITRAEAAASASMREENDSHGAGWDAKKSIKCDRAAREGNRLVGDKIDMGLLHHSTYRCRTIVVTLKSITDPFLLQAWVPDRLNGNPSDRKRGCRSPRPAPGPQLQAVTTVPSSWSPQFYIDYFIEPWSSQIRCRSEKLVRDER